MVCNCFLSDLCPLEEQCHLHDIVGLDDFTYDSVYGTWNLVASSIPEGHEQEYLTIDTNVKFLFNEDGHADVFIAGKRGCVKK